MPFWHDWLGLTDVSRTTDPGLDLARLSSKGLMKVNEVFHYRGWLSGKYKRNQEGFEEGSRVGWTSQDTKRVMQSHPNYDQFNQEKTWKLLEKIGNIGKQHGRDIKINGLSLI